LSSGLLYRSDIKEAVRIFRPVLRGLKIRDEANHPVIFFAGFDGLAHLNLDECSVQVLIADISTAGVFAIKYTSQGLLRAYIVLSQKLYGNPKKADKELRKIAGVHEFVHFIAVVYVATVTSPGSLRANLLQRLQRTVEKLPEADLITLYKALTSKVKECDVPGELTDAHFRLGYEGLTPDYELLFLHFMFSRELFESYFDTPKQNQFKDFIAADNDEKAISLLTETLYRATNDKDVPIKLALNQLLEWVHVYTRMPQC
jgi:hypothetical protein